MTQLLGLLIFGIHFSFLQARNLPLVVTTWANTGFMESTRVAFKHLVNGDSRMNSLVEGLSTCERLQCDTTVGYGGSPDENGETTLDALLIDGPGHRIGAVAQLRRVKSAARVAWAVMNYTQHTFLVGELATQFAIQMGFREENLTTPISQQMMDQWHRDSCQPNFRINVSPDPKTHCGPYKPVHFNEELQKKSRGKPGHKKDLPWSHDTIGMIVVDESGQISAGTSTNGARYKVPGRVGDSPIPGSGAYADWEVGAAAGTGDGDIMMRYLPAYQAVESMRQGAGPQKACEKAMSRIIRDYPTVQAAVIAATPKGEFGAACVGMPSFTYSAFNRDAEDVQLFTVKCLN